MQATAVRAALATATMLTLLVPARAHAGELDIEAEATRSGTSVTVAGGCEDEDRRVRITGAARGEGEVVDGWFTVRARVVRDRAGTYGIEARCTTSGYTQQGTVRVRGGEPERDKDAVVPHGWADTGGGGTQGTDLPWLLAGLAMVGAAAGIGGTALARSRASRGRQ
ncbi:hypothetical protein [Actinomadura sp. 9N407]|uniref:hypothetical protein n=1 Tax=Actinomadura sp. 9N407 TaxID=3375154 RepID=UPI00378B4D82